MQLSKSQIASLADLLANYDSLEPDYVRTEIAEVMTNSFAATEPEFIFHVLTEVRRLGLEKSVHLDYAGLITKLSIAWN